MTKHVIVLDTVHPNASVQSLLAPRSGTFTDNLRRLKHFIMGLQGGVYGGGTGNKIIIGGVEASATLTFTGAPVNNETFTLNGVTFTAKTSGAVANEFDIGGSVTVTATNVVNAVNASVSSGVAGVVTASSVAGVVTFTSTVPGRVGNGVPLSEALTNATVSGNLAGGTEVQNVTYTV